MIDRGKHSVIGVGVDVVDYEGAVQRVAVAAQDRQPLGVTALAVHGVVEARRDPVVGAAVGSLDVVTPDGQPVRWALNWLHGAGLTHRVYGPDLTLAVLARCEKEGLPVYFYGSKAETLAALTTNLARLYPGLAIAGSEPSRFRLVDDPELAEIAATIVRSGARVVFVGLGCPRQELFVAAIRPHLPLPALAVGAAFDFHAGLLSQAPAWMQQRGLEWLYRLSKEPSRLWRRYLLLNPYYVGSVLRQRFAPRPQQRVPVARPELFPA